MLHESRMEKKSVLKLKGWFYPFNVFVCKCKNVPCVDHKIVMSSSEEATWKFWRANLNKDIEKNKKKLWQTDEKC